MSFTKNKNINLQKQCFITSISHHSSPYNRISLNYKLIPSYFHMQLMGIEIPAEYGGTNSTFFASTIVIEELAKVDPSVSVLCDVQNTLVNMLFVKLGTEEQKKKYLTRLAKDMVIL